MPFTLTSSPSPHYFSKTMSYQTIKFPQFPNICIFLSYFDGVTSETLKTIKEQLIARNEEYDYCFLSSTHLVSLQQLRSSLYAAVRNQTLGVMKATSINTEIIFGLSPVNNINDALRRFGVDETRADIVVIRVCESGQDFEQLQSKLEELIGCKPLKLTDEILFSKFDVAKFKKLFKLQAAETQEEYTQGAIESSLIRGL